LISPESQQIITFLAKFHAFLICVAIQYTGVMPSGVKPVISPTYMHLTLISCICYENVNIRGRKYLWYRFFV